MANRTNRRGRGFAPRRVKLNAQDGAALRKMLDERHGYSAEEAFAGLLSGELATVLIAPEEQPHLLQWLDEAQTDNVLLQESLASLARQLRWAWESESLH